MPLSFLSEDKKWKGMQASCVFVCLHMYVNMFVSVYTAY